MFRKKQNNLTTCYTSSVHSNGHESDYVTTKFCKSIFVVVCIMQQNPCIPTITIKQSINSNGDRSKSLSKNVPIWVCLDGAKSDYFKKVKNGKSYTLDDGVAKKTVMFWVRFKDLNVSNGFNWINCVVGESHKDNVSHITFLVVETKNKIFTKICRSIYKSFCKIMDLIKCRE